MKLPRPCINKAVCDLTFKQRMEDVGRATSNFVSAAFDDNGRFDRDAAAPYAIAKDGDDLVCKHISGAVDLILVSLVSYMLTLHTSKLPWFVWCGLCPC